MQLVEDGEGGARGREVGMLEEAALGREEGVPGCVCGVGGRGAEEGIVVECAGGGLYCILFFFISDESLGWFFACVGRVR